LLSREGGERLGLGRRKGHGPKHAIAAGEEARNTFQQVRVVMLAINFTKHG